ncbi:uncharacterized protein LOC113870466 [Abrus precatorius]|uniref:Uncharacterized protein LOC113870466 n=1 Tax=Abrus precatorius TaxID=3816 RepID=A0A8B8M2F4_ABRPR|nr:uncharacterized protein LOC113870466 [Abrus precatorius]
MAAAKRSGASGIVHEAVTKENYDNWSTLVRNYLQGAGLWSVVDPNHENGEKIKTSAAIWKRKDAMALHIIQLACGSEVLSNIRDAGSARDAWNKLSSLYNSKYKVDDDDIEKGEGKGGGVVHMYVENNMWNEAKSLLNNSKDRMLIFSTTALERTALHVAVIAGHERIVNNLVNRGKKKLAEMRDRDGYTALALAAKLTGNTEIAKIMVEMKGGGGEKLLTMETRKGEIPVLLAASKCHGEMTHYLFQKTPLEAFRGDNLPRASLLLTRCITAQIFDVVLMVMHQNPQLPLNGDQARLQEDIGPLYALAGMPSAFPSGCEYGLLKRLVYKVLILETIKIEGKDSNGKAIEIEVKGAQEKWRYETSFLALSPSNFPSN